VKLDMKRIGGPRPPKKKPPVTTAGGATTTPGSTEGGGTSAEGSGEPPPPPPPKKTGGSLTDNSLFIPGVAAAGVGAASLIVGTAFGVLALNETADLKRKCKSNKCPDTAAVRKTQDAALLDGNVSTAMFIVGGVGVAAGGVLLALVLTSDPPKGKEKAKAFVRPWIGAGEGGVYGAF
jgi:hypothetical protein